MWLKVSFFIGLGMIASVDYFDGIAPSLSRPEYLYQTYESAFRTKDINLLRRCYSKGTRLAMAGTVEAQKDYLKRHFEQLKQSINGKRIRKFGYMPYFNKEIGVIQLQDIQTTQITYLSATFEDKEWKIFFSEDQLEKLTGEAERNPYISAYGEQ